MAIRSDRLNNWTTSKHLGKVKSKKSPILGIERRKVCKMCKIRRPFAVTGEILAPCHRLLWRLSLAKEATWYQASAIGVGHYLHQPKTYFMLLMLSAWTRHLSLQEPSQPLQSDLPHPTRLDDLKDFPGGFDLRCIVALKIFVQVVSGESSSLLYGGW